MDEPEDYFEPYQEELADWEPGPSRLPGCWVMVAVVLVLVLLGSSFAGLIWFFQQHPAALPTPVPSSTQPSVVDLSPNTPTAVADNRINRIAYINNDGQIATIAPDGTAGQQLTNENGIFTFPAWSPDGQKIAAIGSGRLGTALYTLEDRATSKPLSLYISNRAAPFYLYWAPNSQTISFLVNQAAEMGLHLVPADGSHESQQLSSGEPFYWQWTTDSQQLLLHTASNQEEPRLTFLDVAGEPSGSTIATSGYFQTPQLSADGRLLIYAAIDANQNRQIVATDVSSGQAQTYWHVGHVAMSLSPTDDLLAYISPDDPEATDFYGPLRLLNLTTGQTQLLLNQPVAAFFWSPNGRYLAAFVPEQPERGPINVAAPPSRLSYKMAAQGSLPSLKLVVLDTSRGDGRVLLTFTPTYTFLGQFLPFFDQYALSHHIWSPESDALVLPILEDGRTRIYIVPIHGGSKRFLAEGSMAAWSQQ